MWIWISVGSSQNGHVIPSLCKEKEVKLGRNRRNAVEGFILSSPVRVRALIPNHGYQRLHIGTFTTATELQLILHSQNRTSSVYHSTLNRRRVYTDLPSWHGCCALRLSSASPSIVNTCHPPSRCLKVKEMSAIQFKRKNAKFIPKSTDSLYVKNQAVNYNDCPLNMQWWYRDNWYKKANSAKAKTRRQWQPTTVVRGLTPSFCSGRAREHVDLHRILSWQSRILPLGEQSSEVYGLPRCLHLQPLILPKLLDPRSTVHHLL